MENYVLEISNDILITKPNEHHPAVINKPITLTMTEMRSICYGGYFERGNNYGFMVQNNVLLIQGNVESRHINERIKSIVSPSNFYGWDAKVEYICVSVAFNVPPGYVSKHLCAYKTNISFLDTKFSNNHRIDKEWVV